MNEALTVYGIVAGVLLFLGIILYADSRAGLDLFLGDHEQTGARLILGAAVWPVLLPLLVVRALFYWVPRIWKAAGL